MNTRKALLILFIITFIWIASWFRNGKMYAGGEEGLPFYNLYHMAQLSQYTWLEVGTGLVNPTVLPRYTTYFTLSLLERTGMQPVAIQAIYFFFLLLVSFWSFYFLSLQLFHFRKDKYTIALISSIFYVANSFSMANVWNRFLFPLMNLQALFPLFLCLYIKGISGRKYYYSFLASFMTIVFSYTFAAPSSLFVIWLPVLIYSLYTIKLTKDYFFNLKFLFFSIFLFLVFNYWWIMPYVRTASFAFPELLDIKVQLASAQGVSNVNRLWEVIRLLNSTYFFNIALWGNIYNTVLFSILSWLAPIFLVFGIFVCWKDKYVKLLVVILAVGIFLSNGTNPPLGVLFTLFFTRIPFFVSARNPYEKLGLIMVLAYSPILAVGIITASKKYFPRKVLLSSFIILFLLSVVFVWPMWSGYVIGGKFNPKVQVPEYYDALNIFLKMRNNFGKLLVLPISPGDGGVFNWPGGNYSGVEPSHNILPFYSIGQALGSGETRVVAESVHASFSLPVPLWKISSVLGAKDILLRNDLNYNAVGATSPGVVRERVVQGNKFMKIFDAGELEVWRMRKDTTLPLFYLSESVSKKSLLEVASSFSGTVPKPLEYRKLDSTRYVIKLQDDKRGKFLNFNQTYDPNWSLTFEGKKIESVKSNGFANAFPLDGIKGVEVSVVFVPERDKNNGISLLILGLGAGMATFLVERRLIL